MKLPKKTLHENNFDALGCKDFSSIALVLLLRSLRCRMMPLRGLTKRRHGEGGEAKKCGAAGEEVSKTRKAEPKARTICLLNSEWFEFIFNIPFP